MGFELRNSSQGIGNVYGNYVYGPKSSKININHGWKLHAGFVRDSTMQKVLDDVGVGAYNEVMKSGHSKLSMGIANQDKFDIFAKRVSDAMGVDVTKLSKGDFNEFMSKFIDLRQARDGTAGATDIFRQLDFYEQANARGLLFKGDVSRYGAGRELTFYAGGLERRDRTIQILESQFSDILQDADDIMPTMPEGKAVKNSKISQKTIGRFTTDYLPADYKNLTEAAEGMGGRESMVDARHRGALSPDKLHMAQTGEISAATSEELGRMAQQHPELGRALHGKPGYVSDYATIDDIIDARAPAQGPPQSSAPATRTLKDGPNVGSAAEDISTQVSGKKTPLRSGPVEKSVEAAENAVNSRPPPAAVSATAGRQVPPPGSPTAQASGPQAARTGVGGARASTGAPVRSTGDLVARGRSLANSVTQGAKGARNLKVLGAGLLVGVGAQQFNSYRGSRQMREQEALQRLEMQRRGMLR